nr:hypothetical protein [Tanacetum cinerariifolium]
LLLSNGSLVDKIICDLNRAPDSPHLHTFLFNQRHCFQCKDVLGNGEFYQRCTCMRCGSGLSKGLCLICGNNQNSLNDSPSIFENSSQSPPHIKHHCCYECGDPLEGAHIGFNCPPKVSIISYPEPCKNQTIDELPQTLPSFHPTCYSGDESPFTCDLTPNIIDDSPNVFNPPPQPLKYSYEFCENDAYYGHDCSPQVPFTYDLEPECDVPSCDDFTTFSNLLFDADDDFSSSDDESFSDEDISKKIYSNPLFDEEIISMKIDPHHFNVESDLIESLLNHNSSIISSSLKIDSFLDEFAGELILLKSIPPRIDKSDCDPKEEIHLIEKLLYDNSSPRPSKEFISKISDVIIESFSPSPIPVEDSDPFMEKINLFLAFDGSIPPGIDSDYSDSEEDNLFLERLLHDDLIPLSDILDFSNVIRVFLPFFTYPVTSSILLSSGSEDIIFDPDISNDHLSYLEPGVSHRSGTFMKFKVKWIKNGAKTGIYRVGGLCWGRWWRASGSRGKWWNGRRSGEKGCGSLAGNMVSSVQ